MKTLDGHDNKKLGVTTIEFCKTEGMFRMQMKDKYIDK